MFIDMMIMSVVLVLFAFTYIYGELACYKRGGDVWPWTVKLAMFLKGRK
jgi:hypothetical protein